MPATIFILVVSVVPMLYSLGISFFSCNTSIGADLCIYNPRSRFECGGRYDGEPVLLSEFGGIAFEDGIRDSWGYNEKVGDEEAFMERLTGPMDAVGKLDYLSGFCYAQFSDVEQETTDL